MDGSAGSFVLIDREWILLLLSPVVVDHKQSGESVLRDIEQMLHLSVFPRQVFIVCWSNERGEEDVLAVSETLSVCNCMLKPRRRQLSLYIRSVDQHQSRELEEFHEESSTVIV
jgi:hypothetical protein